MNQRPVQTVITSHPAAQFAARIIASVFGVGYIPRGAGTVASLIAVLAGGYILRHAAGSALPCAVLAVSMLGLMSTEYTGAAETDPGWIVIDEVAGQWLAMATLLHASILGMAVAFVLFRILDISKFGPVGWVDKRHNAAAVMGDDLVAGAIVAAIIWGIQMTWPHLLT